MGVFGWTELKDGVTLKGVLKNPSLFSDGDWCFHITPAAGFQNLLKNPAGKVNAGGMVECEVEPPDDLKGHDAEEEATVHGFLHNLDGKFVTVVGTWVTDKSHDDKTEIHPVTSLFVEHTPAGALKRDIEFFVFSDDSANFPATVPHSGQNRVGSFALTVDPGAKLHIAKETNMAASKTFKVDESTDPPTLRGRVESGKPDDDKGFYHAVIRVTTPPRKFAGLFGPGQGGQAFVAGMTFEDFVKMWLDLGKKSPPGDMKAFQSYLEGGTRKFAGLFGPGQGGQAFVAGLTFEDFVKMWSDLGKKSPPGDMKAFQSYREGGSWRFAGLFGPGQGGQAFVAGVGFSDFTKLWADLGKHTPPGDMKHLNITW